MPRVGKSAKRVLAASLSILRAYHEPVGSLVAETAIRKLLLPRELSTETANQRPLSVS
jgi:hypothetical protein